MISALRAGVLALTIWPALAAGMVEARPLRVMALDQCADQYVLALAPDADLALSTRADDPDSWMRDAARGRPRTRGTLESAIAYRPDVVVRYWGGEPRLLAALRSRGVRIVTIEDATDMAGVRRAIQDVAAGLNRSRAGGALVARMDRRLTGAGGVRRGPAMYLTAGGFTAGRATLIDAVLTAAGFVNLTLTPGFAPMSVERIALHRPERFVLGFFDQARADWRGAGRHPVVRRAARRRTATRLPGSVLTCPAWFAADAAALLAAS